MNTLKLIKLVCSFDLNNHKIERTELNVTDIPPSDVNPENVDPTWWIIKDGQYTDVGIPKWLHANNVIRQYYPLHQFEALCSPDQEEATLERLESAVYAHNHSVREQLTGIFSDSRSCFNQKNEIKSECSLSRV
jgi:hypothetical protein